MAAIDIGALELEEGIRRLHSLALAMVSLADTRLRSALDCSQHRAGAKGQERG